MHPSSHPRIGLALGSGSARGWSHIGVIRALASENIHPDIVCGTSIGSLVGAAYACGKLDELEHWVCKLDKRTIVKLMDITFQAGGLVEGKKLVDFLRHLIGDLQFSSLNKPFAAVATNLYTGREVWLNQGSVLDGVRASMALPGFFTPVNTDNTWLVDGGLVNPVPVSLCRAMGADIVIAVNLNGGIVGKHFENENNQHNNETKKANNKVRVNKNNNSNNKSDQNSFERISDDVMERLSSLINFSRSDASPESPGLFDVLAGSLNIMQDRITRSRMGGDPPDIIIEPRLARIGLLEFDRAQEAVAEGEAAVARSLLNLREIIK